MTRAPDGLHGIAERAPAPAFDLERARRVARELFGLEADVGPLESSIDRNFVLTEPSGARWVLKVANATEDPAALELQHAIFGRLDRELSGVAPRARPTIGGDAIGTARGADGTEHRVRLVSFVAGETLARAAAAPGGAPTGATWLGLGRLLARVHRALAGLSAPGAGRVLRWDLRHARWTIGRGALFDGEGARGRRALVEALQREFLGHVQPRLAELPRALCHNDANEHNLLVTPAPDGPRVTGLIDFGDAVLTPRVFELAIAGAYAVLDRDPVLVLRELVRGYHEFQPLERRELEVLWPALGMRLVTSLCVSEADARIDPGNAYLRVSQEPIWRNLERVVALEPVRVRRELLEACGLAHGPADAGPTPGLRKRRERLLGPSLSLAYSEPLEIVRGRGTYLFDASGRALLDGVNNVCHVGHAHPRVVAAAARQAAELNTNTRYLHEAVVRYAERLTALLPAPLDTAWFVNSGSEANELVVRLARAATGRRGFIVVAGGYHGHTSTLIDLSPYKHDGPGGEGPPPWVRAVACPDAYRGPHRGADAAERYADEVLRAADELEAAGFPPAAFIAEPLIGCGGQVVPPDGWLRRAFAHARSRGALCIADEVQVGFGRVGTHWWAFEEQGAVPDVVTLGKPMGNGHPLAGVVTTRAVAEAFDNGMEYFSTFGGNPVSAAVGLAVLDVIEDEGLVANAAAIGARLRAGLEALAGEHAVVGDVRGRGLYLGAEFVRDRATREPDAAALRRVIERCRRGGLLLSADGPDHDVLKLKPPLCWTAADADLALSIIERALDAERA